MYTVSEARGRVASLGSRKACSSVPVHRKIAELIQYGEDHANDRRVFVSSTNSTALKIVIASHFWQGTKCWGSQIAELMNNDEDFILIMTLYLLADASICV